MAAQESVALLGLGLMGSGMARRILGAGYSLTVYNRTPQRAAALGADGVRVAFTPREAVAGAQYVIAMLADDAASRAVWLGENGALAGLAPGAALVESSTLSVGWVKELSAAVAKATQQRSELLDAPVTGSKPQAASGELTFLVGGSSSALERARPVLQVMSKQIIHVGPTGSGAMLKLINNFLCGVEAAALAEAVAMLERTGLDRDKALEVLTNGAPGSPLVKVLAGRMASRDYTPNFHLPLIAKDLAYARREAESVGLKLTTAAAPQQLFDRAAAAGHAHKDVSAVVELLRDAGQ